MRRAIFLLACLLWASPVWAATHALADCTQTAAPNNFIERAIQNLDGYTVVAGDTILCPPGDFAWNDAFNTSSKANLIFSGTKTTVQSSPSPTTTTMRLTACTGLTAGHRLSFRVPHTVTGGSSGVDVGTIQSINGTCDVVLTAALTGIPLTNSYSNVTGLTRITYTLTTVVSPNSSGIKLTGFAFNKPVNGPVYVLNLNNNFTDAEVYDNDFFISDSYFRSEAIICNAIGHQRCAGMLVHHNTSRKVNLIQARGPNTNDALTATVWGEEAPWGADASYAVPIMEDNTVYGGATETAFGADCDFSGTMIVRFNRFVDTWVETHGTRGTPPGFGCRMTDAYHNLSIRSTAALAYPYFTRGGSVMIWGNHIGTTFDDDFQINLDRVSVCGVPVGGVLPVYDENTGGNIYPTTTYPGHGWHCLGQPGLGALIGYDVSTDAWADIDSYTLEPFNYGMNRVCASPPCSLATDSVATDLNNNFTRGVTSCVEYQLEVSYATFLSTSGVCGSTYGTADEMSKVGVPVSTAYVYFYVTNERDWNNCVVGNDGQWYRGKSGSAFAIINKPKTYPAPAQTNPDGSFGGTCTPAAPDTTDPVIAITGPTSDATYSTNTTPMTLSGTCTDTGGSGVSHITWSNSAGGSGQADGTATWSDVNVTLVTGENVLTATCYDEAGNHATTAVDTLTVTKTVAAPPPAAGTGQPRGYINRRLPRQ